ncbi:ricin B lectin domain-containing protein [Apodospora peruviana]|uniref:Ricin B lectin domain-containing protein n=1 Tax=Apodospora peruviana TaxID=516989 RepID=A0AAE0I6K7_9PEZI|nr:ricin B lectin domain-containing protein [Apodospora peruviana]
MSEPEQDYLLPDEWDGKVVYLFNEATGTMLDLGAGASWNGNPVIGWEFCGSGAQQWRLQKVQSGQNSGGAWGAWVLRNVAANTVLDLNCGDDNDGTRLQGWEYTGAGNGNQEWMIITKEYNNTSRCIIQNTASYTVADMAGGNRSNGTPIIGWHRDGWNGNQLWRMQLV